MYTFRTGVGPCAAQGEKIELNSTTSAGQGIIIKYQNTPICLTLSVTQEMTKIEKGVK